MYAEGADFARGCRYEQRAIAAAAAIPAVEPMRKSNLKPKVTVTLYYDC